MSPGSGIAFLSIPAVLAVIGYFFDGGDALAAIIIIGCVGYVQVARTVRAVEERKKPLSMSQT